MNAPDSILYVATTSSHIYHFMLPFIKMMCAKGYYVDVLASKDHTSEKLAQQPEIRTVYALDISRNPLHPKNLKAYKSIKRLLRQNNYQIIHTNTPVASFYARLAARGLNHTKVVYMAHGFHFFKGAPIKNWLFYFPAEWLASRFTDDLITINHEDHKIAKRWFKHCRVHYVPGTGLDLQKYKSQETRDENTSNIIICVGEFITRKNHKQVIHAIPAMLEQLNPLEVWFVGTGPLLEEMKTLAQNLGIDNHIKWLGFRYDVPALLDKADMAVLTSYHEGVPRCLLEAMASSKPIVATDVRGSRELIREGQNGYLVPVDDPKALAYACIRLLSNPHIERMGDQSYSLCQKYNIKYIIKLIEKIYGELS